MKGVTTNNRCLIVNQAAVDLPTLQDKFSYFASTPVMEMSTTVSEYENVLYAKEGDM